MGASRAFGAKHHAPRHELEKDAYAYVSDRQPRKAPGVCRLPQAWVISRGRADRFHLRCVREGCRCSPSEVRRDSSGVKGSSAEALAAGMRLRAMSAAREPGSINRFI